MHPARLITLGTVCQILSNTESLQNNCEKTGERQRSIGVIVHNMIYDRRDDIENGESPMHMTDVSCDKGVGTGVIS